MNLSVAILVHQVLNETGSLYHAVFMERHRNCLPSAAFFLGLLSMMAPLVSCVK